jgi:hypothetical protein
VLFLFCSNTTTVFYISVCGVLFNKNTIIMEQDFLSDNESNDSSNSNDSSVNPANNNNNINSANNGNVNQIDINTVTGFSTDFLSQDDLNNQNLQRNLIELELAEPYADRDLSQCYTYLNLTKFTRLEKITVRASHISILHIPTSTKVVLVTDQRTLMIFVTFGTNLNKLTFTNSCDNVGLYVHAPNLPTGEIAHVHIPTLVIKAQYYGYSRDSIITSRYLLLHPRILCYGHCLRCEYLHIDQTNDYSFLTRPLPVLPIVGMVFYITNLDDFIIAFNNIISPGKLNIPMLYLGILDSCNPPAHQSQSEHFKIFLRQFKSSFEGQWSVDKEDNPVFYFSNNAYEGRMLDEQTFTRLKTARKKLIL